MYLILLFVAFSCANIRHSTRTSKEDAIAAAKEYLAEQNALSPSSSATVNATQIMLDKFEAQVNAMPAGPQKTAAQTALNNLRQHASRNPEKIEKKARKIFGKRTQGEGGLNVKGQMLNPSFGKDKTTEITDQNIKLTALQNSTVMTEYKATMHAAAMEKIEGAKKRHQVPTITAKRRFIK